MKKINFEKLINHSTILYGEINIKKTLYTAKFLKFLLEKKKVNPENITILDFAPKLKIIGGMKIGGRIYDYYKYNQSCITPKIENEIIPPRLKSRNKKDLCKNALHNYNITQKLLEQYYEFPTDVLLINDISIYLHLGNKKFFLDSINKSKTFLGNIYYGDSIGKKEIFSLFNLKEKKYADNLIKKANYSFHLTK
ncbi:MAG: hypothetical protein P8Y97_12775 [Candidatus Lokiarchaeota archaeon]